MYKTQQSACWCWIRQDVYIVATIVWLSTSSMFLNLLHLILCILFTYSAKIKRGPGPGDPSNHLSFCYLILLYHTVSFCTYLSSCICWEKWTNSLRRSMFSQGATFGKIKTVGRVGANAPGCVWSREQKWVSETSDCWWHYGYYSLAAEAYSKSLSCWKS